MRHNAGGLDGFGETFYYVYLSGGDYTTTSTTFAGAYMGLGRSNRADSDFSVAIGNTYTIPGANSIPDGTTLRIEIIGDQITGYLDGIPRVTATDAELSGVGSAGFAIELYEYYGPPAGDGGFVNVTYGALNPIQGTIAETLSGGETRILLSSAMVMQPWNEWFFIVLDGGGYHVSRIVDGYASATGGTPVFYVDITTAFPAGSTATAGNVYQLRENF